MPLNLRPMTGADKPAIMEILRRTPEFLPEEVIIAEEVCDCYLADPLNSGYFVVVAETGSGVEGYICYGPTPLTWGTWDIYWIAVSPDKKGQGTGTALMEYAEAKIREAKGRMILLETSSKPDYENTRDFYQSRGYREVSRIADFYAPSDDMVILQKLLI